MGVDEFIRTQRRNDLRGVNLDDCLGLKESSFEAVQRCYDQGSVALYTPFSSFFFLLGV